MRIRLNIHLKSGHTIKVRVKDFSIKYNEDGDCYFWNLEGMSPRARHVVFIQPSQIAAVTRR